MQSIEIVTKFKRITDLVILVNKCGNDNNSYKILNKISSFVFTLSGCTLCIFFKKFIIICLTNWILTKCLQDFAFEVHYENHSQSDISISVHSILQYFDEWQELWREKNWSSLFFCINLMKCAAFVWKTVVCHIPWMLKMKEPNKIRYFIEFWTGC